MTNNLIVKILREAALNLKHAIDPADLSGTTNNTRFYEPSEFIEFKRDLTEAARRVNMLVLEYSLQPHELLEFVKKSREVLLLFNKVDLELDPYLLKAEKSRLISLLTHLEINPATLENNFNWLNDSGGITCLVILPYKSFVSNDQTDASGKQLSPAKRLVKLLGTERKEIGYILVYAVIIGLVSLILPLGLQTTVELISGGVFFSSVYILIGLVILGVLITGILQVVQMTLVEHLQRRIFTKAAFEFAYRIPRIRMESLFKNYTPELVNRFFDVITIQKGLPKLLIDLSSAGIQILFGVVLLSLYHPFFVFFSFFLVLVLSLILYLTGSPGLNSSLKESKYKYKVVQWLEELARAMNSFKLSGNTELPIKRADSTVSSYLKYRKTHFNILLVQFSSFVLFKVAVTGGLLIMGTILVINREITLGQFVASEVIIILVLNAVEKILMYMDVVYDLLTAVDKVSHLTDLPLDRNGGFDFPKHLSKNGYSVSITNLDYSYEHNTKTKVIDNINLQIQSGERVCIAGTSGSGKSTLTNIIAGIYTDYTGGVSVNGFSLRDLDLTHLRDKIGKNISAEDLFDGTLYENLTLDKPGITIEDVQHALVQVGLKETVDALPDGLHTHVLSAGKGLSDSMIHRIILARCLAKKPSLLILNDFFTGLSKAERLQLIRCVINPENKWTLLVVSSDPIVMASCDRVILMHEGKIVGDDTYAALLKTGLINQYFE